MAAAAAVHLQAFPVAPGGNRIKQLLEFTPPAPAGSAIPGPRYLLTKAQMHYYNTTAEVVVTDINKQINRQTTRKYQNEWRDLAYGGTVGGRNLVNAALTAHGNNLTDGQARIIGGMTSSLTGVYSKSPPLNEQYFNSGNMHLISL